MPAKSVLRQDLLKKRARIPAALRRRKNQRIHAKLFFDPLFTQAEHVALYYGVRPEVETRVLLAKILKKTMKKIYLPRTDMKNRVMSFRRVQCLTRDLEKGFYGIPEPKARCRRRSANQMDLIIVPGVGFDRAGGRLGRGGGYYDRILRRAVKVPKIGLCFREQLVKKIPMLKTDVRVNKVITA